MKYGFILAACLLAGCASFGPAKGPLFKESEAEVQDHAILYIYRPDAEFNRGGFAYIFLNGARKLPMKPAGYMVFSLAPGNYEIKAEGSKSGTNWYPGPATLSLELEGNRDYFVRVLPMMAPGEQPGLHLLFSSQNTTRTLIEVIPKSMAMDEIFFTRLIEK